MTVKTVFRDLRQKGLIKKTKYCRWSPFVGSFKAGVLFRRTMFYDKKYDTLDEDLTRFALLHEDGHHHRVQYAELVLLLDAIIIMASVLITTRQAGNAISTVRPFLFGMLPLYIWMILLSLKIFSQYIHKDEFKSDLFAATTLRDTLGVNKPSECLDRLLKALGPTTDSDSAFWRTFTLLLGGLHPLDDIRVKEIRDKVDIP